MPRSRRELSQDPDMNDYRSPKKVSAQKGGALSTISSQLGDRDPSTYEKPTRSNNQRS